MGEISTSVYCKYNSNHDIFLKLLSFFQHILVFMLGMTTSSIMLSLILCFRYFFMPRKIKWKDEEELIRTLLAIHQRHQRLKQVITPYGQTVAQSPFQNATMGTVTPMAFNEAQIPMGQQQIKFTGILPLPQQQQQQPPMMNVMQPSPTMQSPMGTMAPPVAQGKFY